MATLPLHPVQRVLSNWHEQGKMIGFFRWLEEEGIRCENIEEMIIKGYTLSGFFDLKVFCDLEVTDPCTIDITFKDGITVHKQFAKSELG